MAAASLSEIQKSVTAAINAGTAGLWSSSLSDDRRSGGEIQHAIVSADADVCMAILDTPGHPLRVGYMTTVTLTHGATIPASVGEYGPVEIQITPAGAYFAAEPATRTEIELWRENQSGIFGQFAHTLESSVTGAYYCIQPPLFYMTGTQARMWVGQFVPNYAAPVCQAPDVYTPAIVSLSIARLLKEGDQTEVFALHTQLGSAYMQMIREKAVALPSIEASQRMVG